MSRILSGVRNDVGVGACADAETVADINIAGDEVRVRGACYG